MVQPTKPGEIFLAHHGILFLDELPEFQRHVLTVLREPMESGEINIFRASAQVCFPATFTLVVALNPCPCPCGYFGSASSKHHCRYSPDQARLYRQKISGPLLDRIDLHVPVAHTTVSELQKSSNGEKSEDIKQRVIAARQKQLVRRGVNNSRLTKVQLNKHCKSAENDRGVLDNAVDALGLSARAYDRILKTVRTIADLKGKGSISKKDISGAVSFRNVDR